MSTGNGGAAIGLANSNKIVPIGSPPLVPDALEPTAGVDYAGVNLKGYWTYNFLGEDAAFTVPSTNAGKNCMWVTSGAAPIVVSADGSMAVTGGGVATAAVGGAFKSLQVPAATIPAGAWFWTES